MHIITGDLYFVILFQMADYRHEQPTPLCDVLPYQNHGNAYPSLILVFLLGSCGIAISLIPLLSLPTDLQFTTNIILAFQYSGLFYMLLVIAISLLFICKYQQWACDGTIRNQTGSNLHHVQLLPEFHSESRDLSDTNRSSSLQIVVFGIGSILNLITHIIIEAMKYSLKTVEIINSSVMLLCCCVYIVFLNKYKGVTLKTSQLFQYSIAFIIGAEICAWVFFAVEPLWIISMGNATHPVSNNSTGMIIVEITEIFLQPFLLEFLSISVAYHFSLWHRLRGNKPTDYMYERYGTESNHSTRVVTHQDYRTIIDDTENQSINDIREGTVCSRILKCIIAILSTVTALFYFVTFIILIMGPFSGLFKISLPLATQNVMMKCIQTAVNVLLIIFGLLSLKKLQTSSENIMKVKQFTTEGFILLFTTSAVFVYTLLKFFAAFESSGSLDQTIFFIGFEIGCIIRYWFQTQMIITAHYVRRSAQKLPKIVEFTLIYVIAINLIEWTWIAIMHRWVEDEVALGVYDPILVAAFGEVTAKKTHLILDPFRVVHAFHSAAVAYRVQKVTQISRQ